MDDDSSLIEQDMVTSDEFDVRFDSGDDMSDLLEFDKAFHDDGTR